MGYNLEKKEANSNRNIIFNDMLDHLKIVSEEIHKHDNNIIMFETEHFQIMKTECCVIQLHVKNNLYLYEMLCSTNCAFSTRFIHIKDLIFKDDIISDNIKSNIKIWDRFMGDYQKLYELFFYWSDFYQKLKTFNDTDKFWTWRLKVDYQMAEDIISDYIKTYLYGSDIDNDILSIDKRIYENIDGIKTKKNIKLSLSYYDVFNMMKYYDYVLDNI